jgi:hypothetical protein
MPRHLSGAATTTTAASSGTDVSELADLSDWDAFNAANTTAISSKLDETKLVRIDSSATGRIMISGGSGTVLDSDIDVTTVLDTSDTAQTKSGNLTLNGTLTAVGIACNGNLLVETGREIRIGSNQISTSNLSDTASILNTSAGAQTKAGSLTISGTTRVGILEISDASHQAEVDSDGHLLFGIPSGDEYRFIIGGVDAAVVGASSMSIAGQTVATQAYVISTLTSAETAASTIGLVQASPLTLAQALTCNNNVIIGDASSDTLTCNATPTFNTNVNLSATSEIVRGSINVMQRLTELHRDYRHTVTLTNPTADSIHDLFSTDGTFQVFEYGATTSTNATLPTEACYSMTLNFGNGWTFGSTTTYNSLRCAAFGITSEQDNSTNDTIDPNTSTVPSSWNYHRSELPTPTLSWTATSSAAGVYRVVFPSTMSTLTANQSVTIILKRIMDW